MKMGFVLIAAVVSVVASLPRVPSPYWRDAEHYVYYTVEDSTCVDIDGRVAYFVTDDGNVWGWYIESGDAFEEDADYRLTFENVESKAQYVEAERLHAESTTLITASIVEIRG